MYRCWVINIRAPEIQSIMQADSRFERNDYAIKPAQGATGPIVYRGEAAALTTV